MYELIYTSVSRRHFTNLELEELVECARKKNHRIGITGILIYSRYEFIQLLEGDEETVKQLFHEIREDSRHSSVAIFYEGAIESRGYDGWSMVFKNMNEEVAAGVEGITDQSSFPTSLRSFANSHQNAGKKIFRMLCDQI